MQGCQRRFEGIGTDENHRERVVLVASSCCAAPSLISRAFLFARRSGGSSDRICVKAHNNDCSNRWQICQVTSCRTARRPEWRGPHFASCGGDLHPFSSSAAQSSSAKCARRARRLAPTSTRTCTGSRRRSAPSAHSAAATSSPATRIGDARRLGGTTGGARGSSQVVAAPDARRVRAPCAFASTPAATCAPGPPTAEFRPKFGGAPRPTRLKSRTGGSCKAAGDG